MIASSADPLELTSYLRNMLFETTDGYIDMYITNYEICARFNKIVDELAKQGIE